MNKFLYWILRIFGILITLASLGYFLIYFFSNINQIPDVNWNFSKISILFILLGFYFLQLVIAVKAWVLILGFFQCKVEYIEALNVFFVAQFAKYIPGNVAQHFGRILLSKKINLPVSSVSLSLVVEAGWLVFSSGLLAFFSLSYLGRGMISDEVTGLAYALYLGPVIFVGAFAGVKISIYAINRIAKKKYDHAMVFQPDFWGMVFCLLSYIIIFLCLGVILDFLLIYIFNQNNTHFLLLTSMFSLAWLVGFLIPGAPAGLGVREALLVAMVSPIYGPGIAVSLAIAYRLITALGDFLAFGLGLWQFRKLRPLRNS